MLWNALESIRVVWSYRQRWLISRENERDSVEPTLSKVGTLTIEKFKNELYCCIGGIMSFILSYWIFMICSFISKKFINIFYLEQFDIHLRLFISNKSRNIFYFGILDIHHLIIYQQLVQKYFLCRVT